MKERIALYQKPDPLQEDPALYPAYAKVIAAHYEREQLRWEVEDLKKIVFGLAWACVVLVVMLIVVLVGVV